MSRQEILNVIDKWVSEGSGWVIDRIDSHYLNVTLYKPLNGSSYIELPMELRNPKKGLINMKNKDEECFRWCHIRHLNPQDKNPERIKKEDRKMVEKLNYDGITFPVMTKHYKKVEKQNEIKVNIFGYEKGQPYPIHVSNERYEVELNLLLIEEEGNKHYVLIKDFNAFMFNQTKHKGRKNFCMYCLQCFSSKGILEGHLKDCSKINGKQVIKMPDKDGNELKFINFRKQIPVPFVIYGDFEALTKKVQGCKISDVDSKVKDRRSYTEAYQMHKDCGYGYKVVCHYDEKLSKSTSIYRGEGAVYKFMKKMMEEVAYCKNMVKKHFNNTPKITIEEEEEFKKATKCHICNEEYNEKSEIVRNHCQISGRFRGSSHKECDCWMRFDPNNMTIPVIFHNLRGYDGHFIMQQIGKILKEYGQVNSKGEKRPLKINVIPNNMERYMAFMLGKHLKFIDSFQFMSSSIDKLASNLRKEDLMNTSKAFRGDELDLMTKKGVYPYDFMDDFEKFNLRDLPSKSNSIAYLVIRI